MPTWDRFFLFKGIVNYIERSFDRVTEALLQKLTLVINQIEKPKTTELLDMKNTLL